MDEIRSFAGNKERQVRIFAAVEVGSRLWPSTSITESGDEAIETHSPSCATLPTGSIGRVFLDRYRRPLTILAVPKKRSESYCDSRGM